MNWVTPHLRPFKNKFKAISLCVTEARSQGQGHKGAGLEERINVYKLTKFDTCIMVCEEPS